MWAEKIHYMDKKKKIIKLDFTDLKEGMMIDMLDLHNGSLADRLRRFADSIEMQESGKTRIRIMESSLKIFMEDILRFLGHF